MLNLCMTTINKIKLITNRWAWGWCLLKKGGDSRASNKPWTTSLEQGTQVSMVTLGVVTTQRLAPRVLGRVKAANRDDKGPAPPHKNQPSTCPSGNTPYNAYPEYSNTDHEMRLESPLAREWWKEVPKQGPQQLFRLQGMMKHLPLAWTEPGNCLGRPLWLKEPLLDSRHKQAVSDPDNQGRQIGVSRCRASLWEWKRTWCLTNWGSQTWSAMTAGNNSL